MNKEELHTFVETYHPNICQIVAYKSGEKAYSDWSDAWAASEDTVMLCGEQVRQVVKVGDNDVSDPEIS